MKDDQHRFLSLLGQLPLCLTAEQAGWVLNCQAHDIPALISSAAALAARQSRTERRKVFCDWRRVLREKV
jgi:hypothetical protein